MAIVTCLTKKFQELAKEAGNLKALVSDRASVMTGANEAVATKLRKDFENTIVNICCIFHRLGLACTDTADTEMLWHLLKKLAILYRFSSLRISKKNILLQKSDNGAQNIFYFIF